MHASITFQLLAGFGAKNIQREERVDDIRKQIASETYHLIIIDPANLGDDGFSIVPKLRRSKSPSRFTPVLVTTGHTKISLVASLRDNGANLILKKPLTAEALHRHVQWLIKDKRPYVECAVYCGPDRRFHAKPLPDGEKGRREEDIFDETQVVSDRELSQAEIDKLIQRGR